MTTLTPITAFLYARAAVSAADDAGRALTNRAALMKDFVTFVGSDDERALSEHACLLAEDAARHWNRFCDAITTSPTPGPWTAYRLVHEATGQPMTPEQVGEYVCNSIKKSALESGTTDFLIVSVNKADGPADVCHVGNGPTSPANARAIAALPDMLLALKHVSNLRLFVEVYDGRAFDKSRILASLDQVDAVIAKVEGTNVSA